VSSWICCHWSCRPTATWLGRRSADLDGDALVPALREGTERVDGGQGVVGVGAVVAGRVGQNVWPWWKGALRRVSPKPTGKAEKRKGRQKLATSSCRYRWLRGQSGNLAPALRLAQGRPEHGRGTKAPWLQAAKRSNPGPATPQTRKG